MDCSSGWAPSTCSTSVVPDRGKPTTNTGDCSLGGPAPVHDATSPASGRLDASLHVCDCSNEEMPVAACRKLCCASCACTAVEYASSYRPNESHALATANSRVGRRAMSELC